ncbi:MAG TPA: YdeI/OmpD-associated family protein [Bacteroidia bacterium]|nr:YdeI/OmpD-associated family protein [Bacteroidia bacterium]
MSRRLKEIDAYIAKAADFAQPVLKHFRDLVHDTCPDVEERVKWGFPHFDYRGGPMCSMASFKQHCAIGFWKAPLMKNGKELVAKARSEEAMGHLGKITSLKDLPAKRLLVSYIKEAMRLNEAGIKLKAKKPDREKKASLRPAADVLKALSKHKEAGAQFNQLSYSHRKAYLQWIEEAKTALTREKRIMTMLEWVSEGKHRHWKYKSKV